MDGDTGAVLTEAGTQAVRSGSFSTDKEKLAEFKDSGGGMFSGLMMRMVRFVFIYMFVTHLIKWWKGGGLF